MLLRGKTFNCFNSSYSRLPFLFYRGGEALQLPKVMFDNHNVVGSVGGVNRGGLGVE